MCALKFICVLNPLFCEVVEVEPEGMGKGDLIVVYDLPSENRLEIGNKGLIMRVKNLRIQSLRRLHRLGLLCTESVVIVPRRREKEIHEAIERIYKDYEALAKEQDLDSFIPVIKVIELVTDQERELKDLAQRKLLRRLDELIDRIASVMSEIEEIVEEEKLKKIKSGVRRAMRELAEVEKLAKELGISTNGKVDLLYSLYTKALEKCKEVLEA